MSTATPQIHLALAAIIRDADAIAKDRKNEAQGFKFRGIDDVYNALHPIFAAHGVVCLPFVDTLTPSTFKNAKGNDVFRTHVIMGYRFTASDGSFSEAKTVGEGMDHGDKSCAKALSVAHKYLLLQTFLIPTADLEDGDFYDPTVMPREELKKLREENARLAVESGNRDLPAEQVEALARRREEAAASNLVQGTPVESVPTVTDNAPEVLPPEKTKATVTEPAPDPEAWKAVKCHFGTAGGKVLGKTMQELFVDAPLKKAVAIMEWFKADYMQQCEKVPKLAGNDDALYNALLHAEHHVAGRREEGK